MGHRYVMVERASAAEYAAAFPPPPPPQPKAPPAAANVSPYISAAKNGAEARPAPAPAPASSGRGATGGKGSANSGHGASGGSNGGDASGGAIVIKMRGLPYSATETEIANFFSGMRISPGGVSIGRDASGRASGEAHVEFTNEADAQQAMMMNRQRIGSRYIELFRTKQPPSAARRAVASASTDGGSTSECLRLRGMPFNSTEQDVHAFFKGYSIGSGGVKMGPQVGQGTVRFTTAEEARRALVSLNHSYMGSRYIELFYN